MTAKPLRYHFALATTILVVSYTLFTLFSVRLPHPEDLSPYVYISAFLLCLQVWLSLPGSQKRLYWPILLLCLLALLDETGYGSEVMDITPFYSTRHNTEIRDLHNALEVGRQLVAKWLADRNWQAQEFFKFLALDSALLLGGFLFTWRLRVQGAKRGQAEQRNQLIRLSAWAQLGLGLAAAGWLLALPGDTKNAIWAGYSAVRLLMVAGILAASALPLALARRADPLRLGAKLSAFLTGSTGRLAALAALLLGLGYQVYAPFVFLPDEQTQLARLTPLVMWLFGAAALFMLIRLVWQGRFRNSVRSTLRAAAGWLRQEPAYFYAGYAIVIIIVAQLIDRELIPLNQWIQPSEHISLWGLWTEEVLEMCAGAFFLLAGAHFNLRQAGSKEAKQ